MKKNIFFSREEHLRILTKRVENARHGYRQNIAIIGDELVGKSSIVFNFLSKLDERGVIPLYMEIRQESLFSFARRFIGVLLYGFLAHGDLSLKEDLDFLIEKSAVHIPRTVERIRFILSEIKKRKKDNIFFQLLTLCEIIHQETQKLCVVIFDEFHNFENLGSKKIFAEWSRILLSCKNTLYVILSSRECKAKNILAKELNLLFGNFEVITVEPFDVKTTDDYLEIVLNGADINTGLKKFIAHFTGGIPFYLRLIVDSLLNSRHKQLTSVLEELLFEERGVLNQKFTDYIKRYHKEENAALYTTILHLVCEGHNKIRDLSHFLRRPKEKVIPLINRLIEMGLISRSQDFIKINDRVFSFWLRFVHKEKLSSLTYDAKNQNFLFRRKIDEMIGEYLANAKKSVIERTAEVLHLFGDDCIQLERKRLKLNQFREIKPLEFNSRRLKQGLICRSHDSIWIIGFKNDVLTEEDITDFSKECKKYRKKHQRKIIIALKEIDSNSRLRALEEKILTWDVNSLNQIMDFFFKPRVIV